MVLCMHMNTCTYTHVHTHTFIFLYYEKSIIYLSCSYHLLSILFYFMYLLLPWIFLSLSSHLSINLLANTLRLGRTLKIWAQDEVKLPKGHYLSLEIGSVLVSFCQFNTNWSHLGKENLDWRILSIRLPCGEFRWPVYKRAATVSGATPEEVVFVV